MGSVWREKAVDLGVQSNETFGNDSNIVARTFGGDFELVPHIFAHLAHFYPKSRFYLINLRVDGFNLRAKPYFEAINLRVEPCVDAVYTDAKGIDTATKSIFEMPQVGTKRLDCFRGFGVHRWRKTRSYHRHGNAVPRFRLKPDTTDRKSVV